MIPQSLVRQRRLDEICNEFEGSWVATNRPDFSSYLNRVAPETIPELLRSLLEVDVELRIRAGQRVIGDDYRAIHPSAPEIVNACLKSLNPETDTTCAFSSGEDETIAATKLESVGRYQLLEKIGEGGMGTVWRAGQQEPIRRHVALKLIKPGMDSRQIIARFEAERQALAMMDHPNIATVLDAGVTIDGRPYFAMELVQGVPITQYCDDNRLDTTKRLELFVRICNAVQHAHQKGIIHRDLKPSNVLIASSGSQPIPKVIDFGLAKAIQPQTWLTDKSMITEFGQVVGTVQYMSPEQADLNSNDVDTRSDIYSLGVILYELLTGSTPIRKDRIRNQPMLRVLESIRATDPQKPSDRIKDSDESISMIAEKRSIDIRRLQQQLSGDLDWVVMRTLDKDRSHRYESAAALADDVSRFLDNRPVIARKPTWLYRARKYAKRNQSLVAITTTIVAATIVAFCVLVASLLMVNDKNEKLVLANSKESQATIRATEQLKNADRRLILAIQAVEDYFTGVAYDAALKEPGLEQLRTNLLQKPMEFFEQLEKELRNDPSADARLALGTAYQDLWELKRLVGNDVEALKYLDRTVRIFNDLTDEFPNEARYLFKLIQSLRTGGTISNNVGKLPDDSVLKNNEELRRVLTKSLSQIDRLLARAPHDDKILAYKLSCLDLLLELPGVHPPQEIEAARVLAETIDVENIENFSERANAITAIGSIALGLTLIDPSATVKLLDRLIPEVRKMNVESPERFKHSKNLAEFLSNRVIAKRRIDGAYESLDDLKEIFAIRQQTIELAPRNLESIEDAAETAYSLGRRYLEKHDNEQAAKWSDYVTERLNESLSMDSMRFNAISLMQMNQLLRGEIKMECGEFEEALKSFAAASGIEGYHGPPKGGSRYDVLMALADAKLGRSNSAYVRIEKLTITLAPEDLITAGRALAVSLNQVQDVGENKKYQDRAIQLIEQAVEKCNSAATLSRINDLLQSNRDLDELRGLDAFQTLLLRVENKRVNE